MNGVNDIIVANIKNLKINYMIHLIINGITIIFNFILFIEIFWLNSLYYYIYLSLSIFGIFYFLKPIILLIYIYLQKLTQKKIKRMKKITLIICIIIYIIGLCFTLLLTINSLRSIEFFNECPFNLKNSYINNIYDKYVNKIIGEKELKEHCTNRRCILNNENSNNEYSYEYLCNYEPTKEFDEIKKDNTNDTIHQIECIQIEKDFNEYSFEKEEIYKFIEICNSFEQLYICHRITEPLSYQLEDNFICPNNKYLSKLIIFCMLSLVLNTIITYLPWREEYIKYKNILLALNPNNNRAGSKSLNSTIDTSKIKKENENEQVKESFTKEPTVTIVVCTEENMINDINKSYDYAQNTNDKKTTNNLKLNLGEMNIINNEEIKKEIKDSTDFFNKNKEDEKENEINNKRININDYVTYSSERNLKDKSIPKI
jgi:hypothetical protein